MRVLILICLFPFYTQGYDFNGLYECRLGWSWLTEEVEISGFKKAYNHSRYAQLDYALVGKKRFTNLSNNKWDSFMTPPYILLKESPKKRVELRFLYDDKYGSWSNEGLTVRIGELTFDESSGEKWEWESRFCKRKS